MKKIWLVCCSISLAAVLIAAGRAQDASVAQPESSEGAQQFASFRDFRLTSGAAIQDFRLGYRTMGKLNPTRSNAILWPTWLGGKSDDLLEFVGPGKVVDSGKYYVILVDAIGNGISSSPSNSSKQPMMQFPQFTIRDMVEAERRLLTEVLHLSHLHAVMGMSMGGMQTFEWAVAYPDFMDLAIPMAGSPQSTAYDKLLWTAQIDAIELDPAWNGGKPAGPLDRGIALKEEIGSLNVTSPAYRVAHTDPEKFASFLSDLRKSARGTAGDAANAIRQREAIIALDIPKEFGATMESAAARVRAKLLVIVSPEDHMVTPEPALQFAKFAGASVIQLDSPCGHLSFTCISVGPWVAKFLADPGSVTSMVLDDGGGSR